MILLTWGSLIMAVIDGWGRGLEGMSLREESAALFLDCECVLNGVACRL